jgi:CRP-like cAMP-binding protein
MVRIGRLTPEGGVVTVRHVLPGDFFGEESLIGATHGASAQALTDVTVESFDPAFIDAGDVLVVIDSLSRQLQNLMDFGYHLQSGDLYQRVSRYLVWLAGTPLAQRDAHGRTSIGITHEMIAEGTGSTRESVSKIITELRSEGRIESGYRSIILMETSSLEAIAEGFQ